MNEQDIINRIETEANDLPIPDSISPSNMEKMLNEKVKEYTDNNVGIKDSISDTGSTTPFGKRIGLAIVACFGVVIIGSGALTLIHSNNDQSTSNEAVMYESAEETDEADAAYDEAAPAKDSSPDEDSGSESITTGDTADTGSDNVTNEAAEAEETKNIKNSLASSGNISKPESYDDYYDTIYYAYMDSIENSKQAIDIEESRSYDAGLALNEDSAADNLSDTEIMKNDNESYSSTNTQEMDIDEGDVVKTDGTYIYTASYSDYYTDDQTQAFITITKASKGKLTKVSSIPVFNYVDRQDDSNCIFYEFYIHNNYLIVIYGKSGRLSDINYESKTVIDIYDISDRKNAKKVCSHTQSGTFNSSRISDGYLYTTSRFRIDNTIFDNYKNGRDNYHGYIPYIDDDKLPYEDIYYSRHLDTMNTYVLTSVNLDKPKTVTDAKSICCQCNQMYVSGKAIYLYGTIFNDIEKTEIMRIEYDKGKLIVGNRAVIAGYLYGSFALSEYRDHLRIVATIPSNNFEWYDSGVWSVNSNSNTGLRIREDINSVYVLNKNMKMTGKITGLAPGEQIYSARYFGDIGYFVTYRNTDPLFSVDFSDPDNPTILGALKIPGFSNYLHFYGKDTLLGIGEERDPYTQQLYGLKLSMFNIKDPENVTEEDKLVLNNVDYSSAQYDYKSIMIDPEKNIFGFSYDMEDYDEYGNITYSYYYSTYSYDSKTGFTETARYKIDYDFLYNIKDVRGIFIDDYFYLVCPTAITSYKLSSDEIIDSITLN